MAMASSTELPQRSDVDDVVSVLRDKERRDGDGVADDVVVWTSGGEISSDRSFLSALRRRTGWTIDGDEDATRPTPERVRAKNRDRLAVLRRYRQGNEDLARRRLRSYDHLSETLFGVPTRPSDAPRPTFVGDDDVDDDDDDDVAWVEVDWDAHDAAVRSSGDRSNGARGRRTTTFAPNKYPYRLSSSGSSDANGREDDDDEIVVWEDPRHWVLWYWHDERREALVEGGEGASSGAPNVSCEHVDEDLRQELEKVARADISRARRRNRRFDSDDSPLWCYVEYVWYKNPKMTVQDLFHVQVFWRLGTTQM